jgi:molybdenum cofactor biosynthesis enzyme MoaA
MEDIIKKISKNKSVELAEHKAERSANMIYINLGEECNENCVFCVVKGDNQGVFGFLSTNEVKNIIKIFALHGGHSIVFTGGEPTLRNDLPLIIKYAEKFESIQNICIISNGVRLSDKKFFMQLLESDSRHILNFSISLHSHKKSISELLTRTPTSFNKTISGIKNIISNKRQLTIYQVITSRNYKDLYNFSKYLYFNFPTIKQITFAYPFPQGNALQNTWIFPKISQIRPYLLKAFKFLEQKQYQVYIASCGQFPLCAIPGFEGTVLASLEFSERNVLGVVGEKTYHDFEMAGEQFQDFYKNKHPIKCRKCILRTVCQGYWKKYIELFNFDGLRMVTFNNFKGPKLKSNLITNKDLDKIKQKLNVRKLNVVKLLKYQSDYLNSLVLFIKQNNLLTIILNKDNNILYPY